MKISRNDLLSLEEYAAQRPAFRANVMAHKASRRVALGPHATLQFEDRLTMQYQIQEMLRAERIFEPAAIQEELDAYNPLVPDGSNLKATFMIEYADPNERRQALARLIGVEDAVWIRVGDRTVHAIADEDLDRETEDKTSSVHFLRFEFTGEMKQALKEGASLAIGVEHDNYTHTQDPVPEAVRRSLVADLD